MNKAFWGMTGFVIVIIFLTTLAVDMSASFAKREEKLKRDAICSYLSAKEISIPQCEGVEANE